MMEFLFNTFADLKAEILLNERLSPIFFNEKVLSQKHLFNSRSRRPEVLYKKDVLRNCKLPATLLKETLWHRCFPVNFAKFLRAPFSKEHLRWLLL